MLMKKTSLLSVLPIFLVTQNANAQSETNNRPIILENLVNCAIIKNDKDRLACYDQNIITFQTAEEKGEIIVEDKEVILQSREEVFGFKSVDNPVFNGDNDANLNSINSTITSARLSGSRKWLITLGNGSIWQQSEPKRLRSGGPKIGSDILIKKASLGGFIAEIDGQRPFRVKRLK